MNKRVYSESEITELKRQFSDSVPKEVVAFLNTDGGTIYIGVEDDGSVCGVSDLDGTLRKIADIIDNQILPDASENIILGSEYIDGKHIVKVQVKKGSALYYIKKYGRSAQGCFLRVGTTARAMTEYQIEAAHLKYLTARADITEIVGKTVNPTFQYLKIMLVEKQFTVNDATFEQNLHLRTKDNIYNKQAELLADQNEVSIKVVRFAGKDKGDGILQRNEYGNKCLIVAMQQAFEYCAEVLNATEVSFRNGVRHDRYLFDKDAFREAWFNACLHNCWADGTPPAIYVFTDRMEIISTGGLPVNLSREDFFKGVSKPVNEELARLFIRLDLMEQTGYGVPLVVNRYGREAFEFLDGFIRVTIPFAFEIDFTKEGAAANGCELAPAHVRDKLRDKVRDKSLNATQKKIMELINANPAVTLVQVGEQLGIGETAVHNNIAFLKQNGFIKRIGANKNGYWQILDWDNQ